MGVGRHPRQGRNSGGGATGCDGAHSSSHCWDNEDDTVPPGIPVSDRGEIRQGRSSPTAAVLSSDAACCSGAGHSPEARREVGGQVVRPSRDPTSGNQEGSRMSAGSQKGQRATGQRGSTASRSSSPGGLVTPAKEGRIEGKVSDSEWWCSRRVRQRWMGSTSGGSMGGNKGMRLLPRRW